jgi:hypothetical protein
MATFLENHLLVVFFRGFLFLHMKKVMRTMIDVVVLKMMHIKKINSLFYFIKGALRTVFSMTQFLTIRTFELPTKECLGFCFTDILFTWLLDTSAFKTTFEPIFPLRTNHSLSK